MADTGIKSGGTATTTGSGFGAWSSPNAALTDGGGSALGYTGNYSAFSPTTGILKISNFDLSIPSGATIDGIEVFVDAYYSNGLRPVHDYRVQLYIDGSAQGNNKATLVDFTTTEATRTYGGATDKWGLTTPLTATNLNSSSFGVEFVGEGNFSGSTQTGYLYVDWLRIKVYYTTATSYTLTVTNGTITYTGQSVGIKTGRNLSVSSGTVTYTGQTVGINIGRRLTVLPATVNYVGQTVGIRVGRKLTVSHGAISYSGQFVGMSVGTTGRVLTVSNGTITYVGQTVGIRVYRKLSVQNGTVAYVGQSVGIRVGRRLTVSNGTLTYTGQAVGIRVARRLTVSSGLITYTGQTVSITKNGVGSYALTVTNGVITYTGQSVGIRVGRRLTVLCGTISYVGQAVGISLGGLYDHEAEICKEVFDMATAVGICNKALGMAGASNTILSLAEASPMAMACNSYYDDTRLEMTQAISWAFCRRQQRLALLGAEAGTTENPDGASQISEYGWKYTYAYPCDCLEPILIIPSSEGVIATNYSNTGDMRDGQNTTVPFVESTWSNGAGAGYRRIISTNKQNAILVYQANITDPSVFPPDFVSLLTLTLAGKLATFLGNERIAVRLIQQASTIMEQLRHRHSLEYNTDRRPVIYTPSSDYVNVR